MVAIYLISFSSPHFCVVFFLFGPSVAARAHPVGLFSRRSFIFFCVKFLFKRVHDLLSESNQQRKKAAAAVVVIWIKDRNKRSSDRCFIMVRYIFDWWFPFWYFSTSRPRFFYFKFMATWNNLPSPFLGFPRKFQISLQIFFLSIFEWRDEKKNSKQKLDWNIFFFFFTLRKLTNKKQKKTYREKKKMFLFLSGGLPQPTIRSGKIIDHFMLYISRNCTHTVSNEQNVFFFF